MIAVISTLGAGGCKGKADAPAASPGASVAATAAATVRRAKAGRAARRRKRRARRIDVPKLGVDLAETLRALRARHFWLRRGLGAHRLEARSKNAVALNGKPKHIVVQQLVVRADAKGNFAALKTTGEHQGVELRWVGGKLYVRQRYQKFAARRPARQLAPHRLLERVYGLLPAYVELLAPFVAVKRAGAAKHLGRAAVAVRLSLAAKPRPPRPGRRSLARRWRRKISVEALSGRALFDARSGLPLSVELSARWSFVPPKGSSTAYPSGVPNAFGGGLGRMRLSMSQRVTKLGADVAPISAPEAKLVAKDVRRLRLEIERQIITGEREMPDRWPRVDPGTRQTAYAPRKKKKKKKH